MSEITAWISFRLAAEKVERTLGVSWGLAQKTLLEACASNELPTKRSRDGHGGPDIGADEFRAWLRALSAPKPKKRAYKQEEVQKAIEILWPDGKLPAENKVLVNSVIEWFKEHGKPPFERTTILRAAGRRRR
jgi:hypothetical protein